MSSLEFSRALSGYVTYVTYFIYVNTELHGTVMKILYISGQLALLAASGQNLRMWPAMLSIVRIHSIVRAVLLFRCVCFRADGLFILKGDTDSPNRRHCHPADDHLGYDQLFPRETI